MHKYQIVLDKKPVGEVETVRKGLYTIFSCQCDLPEGSMFSLWIKAGEEERRLGTLVPSGGVFTLTKSIPAKYVPQSELEFILKSSENRNSFHPIDPLKPFTRMDSLLSARWGQENGQSGLYFEEIKD